MDRNEQWYPITRRHSSWTRPTVAYLENTFRTQGVPFPFTTLVVGGDVWCRAGAIGAAGAAMATPLFDVNVLN